MSKSERELRGIIDWLKGNLKSYARHWDSCAHKKTRCTCGLDEVLGLEPME